MTAVSSVVVTLCLALLSGRCFPQQQTGAPAGVPVPPSPSSDMTAGSSQTPQASLHFRVRVLDGRNGAPIRNAHVKLWYDEPAGAGYEFATDAVGYGNMPAPVGEPVRVLVSSADYVDCRKPLRGDPPQGYSMSAIASTGVAVENGCGRVAMRTHPGELVLFVRSPHWYEGINRGNSN